eukprot:CAMPEP_0197918388 /NCGR_PEP_ID=MMETSP1439-20131203/85361_1 /TAXON_ID=66791 /ORGANISM="Gonyaulax spinifera, Strain CCMP409" /LENGTH=172 /DNA_ID=CAMNT_0043540507 /DNA_START=19 /DNA_END=535 /DNA_ORIENTATION=-
MTPLHDSWPSAMRRGSSCEEVTGSRRRHSGLLEHVAAGAVRIGAAMGSFGLGSADVVTVWLPQASYRREPAVMPESLHRVARPAWTEESYLGDAPRLLLGGEGMGELGPVRGSSEDFLRGGMSVANFRGRFLQEQQGPPSLVAISEQAEGARLFQEALGELRGSSTMHSTLG